VVRVKCSGFKSNCLGRVYGSGLMVKVLVSRVKGLEGAYDTGFRAGLGFSVWF